MNSAKQLIVAMETHCVCFEAGTKLLNIVSVRPEVLTAVKMSMLIFWVVPPCGLVSGQKRSSTLKTETINYFETLVSTGEPTRRQNPQYHHHHHLPHRESIKSRSCIKYFIFYDTTIRFPTRQSQQSFV